MKVTGFKVWQAGCIYTRKNKKGKCSGIPTNEMKRLIITQQFLPFHQARAYVKNAAYHRGYGFALVQKKSIKEKLIAASKNYFLMGWIMVLICLILIVITLTLVI